MEDAERLWTLSVLPQWREMCAAANSPGSAGSSSPGGGGGGGGWAWARGAKAMPHLLPLGAALPESLGLIGMALGQGPWRVTRKQVQEACLAGIPPKVRKEAWPALVGNQLRITNDLFEVLCAKFEEGRFVTEVDDLGYETMQSESESEEAEAGPAAQVEASAEAGTEAEAEAGTGAGAGPPRERSQSVSPAGVAESELRRSATADLGRAVASSAESESAASAGKSASGGSRRRVLVRRTSLAAQIEQDLSRTFPRLAFFDEGGGPFRQSLRDILEAYALFRPGLGYVQGMSHVAAMLLLNLEREAAFVCFCNILEDHVFFNMVRHRDDSVLAKQMRLFDELLRDHLPRLWAHFAAIDLRPEMFLIDWLLTLLSKALPLDVAARVWDCYLFCDTRERRERFLWRAILALLRMFSIQLQLLDFDAALVFLRKLPDFTAERYFVALRAVPLSASRCAALRHKVGLRR